MTGLIASITPHAVAVALSPMPIAALVLLLLSNKARLNSIAFTFGWVLALIINIGLFAFLVSQPQAQSEKHTVRTLLDYALGLFLLWFAFKEWKSRPKKGEEPKMPKWMAAVENFSPFKSFGIAVLLVTVNAKNTVLDVATGVSIGQNTTSFSEALTVILIYTLIASITIFVPTVAFLLFGNKINPALNNLKVWLIANNATILFVLFLYIGISLIARAMGN